MNFFTESSDSNNKFKYQYVWYLIQAVLAIIFIILLIFRKIK